MAASDDRLLPTPVRWHNSLILRVVLLCVVLVGCLFGAVYAITQYYTDEIVSEMAARTQEIVEQVELQLESNPNSDLDELVRHFEDEHTDIEWTKIGPAIVPTLMGLELREGGPVEKVAHAMLTVGDQRMLLTVRVALVPQTEIVRAFSNRSIALVTVVFLVTLGLLIYFIVRLLRPISELSESCARISQGELANVRVRRNSGEILALEQTFNRMVAALQEKEVVEANLRQAQRLSALGTLSAGIAHDVRNPLNAIKLLSSHALDAVGDGPAAKHLRTIRNEVDRLDDIVSGFLSLAKEREVQPEPCRIDALLTECTGLVRKDAETRDVELVTDLRAGDTELMLDPKQFTRAVINVLLNALEACPAGGRVRLFSRLTDVVCEIEIRDDGPGLTEEAAEHAFEPYFTTRPTGTGLGLSITRGIVEEHGATIELFSVEGQGCQALITIPLEAKVR